MTHKREMVQQNRSPAKNRKIRKKALNLVWITIVVGCVLSGCWDQSEIEQRVSVVAMAIDKEEGGLLVTVQVPIPIKIAGSEGGGGGKEAIQTFSASGENLSEALRDIQKQLNQPVSLGHLRLLIFSETLARGGFEGIGDYFIRNPQIRRRMWPLVVAGKAADVLEIDPGLEQIPSEYIISMLDNEARQQRLFDQNQGKFLNALANQSRQPLLNYAITGKKSINWQGAALFRDQKMVGKLSEEESWVLLQLRHGRHGSWFHSPCPNTAQGKLTIEPMNVDKTITFDPDRMKFDIHVNLEGRLLEKTCRLELSQEKNIRLVEQQFERLYESLAGKMVDKVQKMNSDVLLLGSYVRGYYPEVWDTLNWEQAFPNADIRVTYDVTLHGTGMRYQ